MEYLYSKCLNNNNINMLIQLLIDNMKVSHKSIALCVNIIKDTMKKNIKKLSRPPRNDEELKGIIKYINKLCINTIKEIISKKYNKYTVTNEQFKRELEFNNKKNNIIDYPQIQTKKYDDSTYTHYDNQNLHSLNDENFDYNGNYASAFDDHMITNDSKYQNSKITKTLEQLISERNYDYKEPLRPSTPDFSLEKNNEIDINDPYMSLLGAGSPIYDDNKINNDKSFNDDYEKKIAERELFDLESKQPEKNHINIPNNINIFSNLNIN